MMDILDDIWSNDRKYTKFDGIKLCWRKSDIYLHHGIRISTMMLVHLPFKISIKRLVKSSVTKYVICCIQSS